MTNAVDIARIADEHARLLHAVASYDHAPADLRDTADLLASIENNLHVREARMTTLIKKRKSEHKDIDRLQRSSTKRFLFRVTHGGKEGLERKIEKEEREYIEAAQAEHNESQAIAELKEAAENARTKKAELESKVANRKELLQQIDELYASAFEGPSPDFPEEDAAEDELRDAEAHFEHMQARLTHEQTVLGILDRAAACANQAQSALQSANLSATYDTFGIGGLWAEMAERDDLLRAQTFAAQAQRHLERARGAQPLVNPVPCGRIVDPDWLNVVFDNMYTDFMFQQKIQQSLGAVTRFQAGVRAECAASGARAGAHARGAADAREFLAQRRRALAAVRREILTRVKEEGGGGDVPPAYRAQPEAGAVRVVPAAAAAVVGSGSGSGSGVGSPPGYDADAKPVETGADGETPRAPNAARGLGFGGGRRPPPPPLGLSVNPYMQRQQPSPAESDTPGPSVTQSFGSNNPYRLAS